MERAHHILLALVVMNWSLYPRVVTVIQQKKIASKY